MAAALHITGLKRFFGRQRAVDGLSLSIPEHSVAALVGANGAGKTTTFSLIGRFLRPQAGRIEIMGLSLRQYFRSGGIIGLLPQDVHFYEDRSLRRQLKLFARLAGLDGAAARSEVERVLDLTELTDRARSKPAELSHGLRMRLGIAQALIGKPPLVLLDEPTAGLDPLMQRSFRSVIDELRGNTTVVISSHNLSELENICDYLCIIDQGRLVKEGPLRQLLGTTSSVAFQLGCDAETAAVLPEMAQFKTESSGRELKVHFDPQQRSIGEVNALVLAALLKAGIPVLGVTSERSLEEAYFEQLRGEGKE